MSYLLIYPDGNIKLRDRLNLDQVKQLYNTSTAIFNIRNKNYVLEYIDGIWQKVNFES